MPLLYKKCCSVRPWDSVSFFSSFACFCWAVVQNALLPPLPPLDFFLSSIPGMWPGFPSSSMLIVSLAWWSKDSAGLSPVGKVTYGVTGTLLLCYKTDCSPGDPWVVAVSADAAAASAEPSLRHEEEVQSQHPSQAPAGTVDLRPGGSYSTKQRARKGLCVELL